MSPRTGRPRSSNPKSEGFHIRVTPEEKQEVLETCKQYNVTVYELIRIGIDAIKGK